jgi:hypothetical protein
MVSNIIIGRAVAHCGTKREVPGWIPGKVLGNFGVTYSFCPQSVALGSTQSLTEMSTTEFR